MRFSHYKRIGRAWWALLVLVLCGGLSPAAWAQAPAAPDYYPVKLRPDSSVDASSLQTAVKGIRRDHPTGPQEIVFLVHGYNAPKPLAQAQYADIGRRFTAIAREQGLSVAVVGVHWPTDPGELRRWLTRAVAANLLRSLGFKDAVEDPYRKVVTLSHYVGRNGFRELYFRLEDEFPEAGKNAFAHSLGSDLVLHALSPQLDLEAESDSVVFAPERTPRPRLLCFAGADLDTSLFRTINLEQPAFQGLQNAQLVWFTVATESSRDRVLIVRRLVRRTPAIGNEGPEFTREGIDRLLESRKLIVDYGDIPVSHEFRTYYHNRRLTRLAEALAHLRAPDPAADTLLARLDRILAGGERADLLPFLSDPALIVRVYAAWRLDRALFQEPVWFKSGFTLPEAQETIRRAQRLFALPNPRLVSLTQQAPLRPAPTGATAFAR